MDCTGDKVRAAEAAKPQEHRATLATKAATA
jgi:hypothetical protein